MGHHHGSNIPISAGAVLLHTDQKGPNILTGSVRHMRSNELDIEGWVLLEKCNVEFYFIWAAFSPPGKKWYLNGEDKLMS